MLIALDIDGTLADCSHRLHLKDKSFSAFQSPKEVAKDIPILASLPITQEMARKHNVVLITNRPSTLYETTSAWLKVYFPWLSTFPLLMRSPQDKREGWRTKVQHLFKYGGASRPFLFVDDQPYMLEMVKRMFPRTATPYLAPDAWFLDWSFL